MAFANFCGSVHGLADALRARDWPTVARLYNGPDFARNHYDSRLADAYGLATGSIAQHPLRIGCSGPAVVMLQVAINSALAGPPIATDGGYGRATELAVMRFQKAHGFPVDGIAGPVVEGALGLGNGDVA